MKNEETQPDFMPLDALDRCPSCRNWVYESSLMVMTYANCGHEEFFHLACYNDLARMDDEDER